MITDADPITELLSELDRTAVNRNNTLASTQESAASLHCDAVAIAGGLVAFPPGLSAEQHSDVLDSILLARLAASNNHNRQTDPAAWYHFYISVLENIGWVVQQSDTSNFNLNFDRFSMTLFANLLFSGADKTLMTKIIKSLQQKALQQLYNGKERELLFNSPDSPNGVWNLQLAIARTNNGMLALSMGEATWRIAKNEKSYLRFHFSSAQLNGSKNSNTLVLNDATYGPLRSAIKEKLDNSLTEEITCLNLEQ